MAVVSAYATSPKRSPWRYVGREGEAFVFEVAGGVDGQPMRALDLIREAGFSKPQVTRLFDEHRLDVRTSAGTGELRSLGRTDLLEQGMAVLLTPQVADAAQESGDGSVDAGPANPGLGGVEPASVLYEDDFVVAAEKPCGLLVHGDGTGAPTLTDRVRAYLRESGQLPVAQALQRLDVETSGVVLFSKVAEFQPMFDALVASDAMRKRYLAIVDGAFERESVIYRDPIGRDRHDARRMRVSPGGQSATSFVRRLSQPAVDGRHTLLGVTLGTGRRHQIRVHLSSHGFPIMNDELYGVRSTRDGLMLHAYEESFTHPVTGQDVLIRTQWPHRFILGEPR